MTPWAAACQASLSFIISWSLLRLMSIELMIPSNHLILCHPLLLLPSIFSSIKDFSSELALGITWPKYWSFSFSISPSNEYSGLISFKIDWLDLLAVQGTLQESSPTQQFKSISCLALSLPLPPLCTYPLCIPISSSVQHWSFLPLTRPDPLPFQEATLSFFFCIVSISF